MMRMLAERIEDGAFLQLIGKWLKAGVLEEHGKVVHPATCARQGGIVTPVLANIYLHYVLDLWFEHQVKKQSQGEASNSEEPGAEILHAGICEGGAGQPASLPR